jgi:hypothetical protein
MQFQWWSIDYSSMDHLLGALSKNIDTCNLNLQTYMWGNLNASLANCMHDILRSHERSYVYTCPTCDLSYYLPLSFLCFQIKRAYSQVIWLPNLLIRSVPDKGCYRNASDTLNAISTYLLTVQQKFCTYLHLIEQ